MEIPGCQMSELMVSMTGHTFVNHIRRHFDYDDGIPINCNVAAYSKARWPLLWIYPLILSDTLKLLRRLIPRLLMVLSP